MKSIKFIENKSEIAAGTRGSSLGIDALKVAAWNQEDNFFKWYASTKIKDQNHLLYEPITSKSAIRIEGVVKVYETISAEVKNTLLNNEFPVVLSADHASAGGVIAGVKMAFPDKRIGVIWIDAHGDLHSPFTSPSGNIHGMPLATALNIDNKESKIREVDETTLNYWNQLKNTGGIAPKILATDLVFFGVRDTEAPEEHLVKKLGIKNYSVEECRKRSFKECASEALKSLNACDLIYISFDVDSMDSDKVSVGTGTPVENGFFPKEAEALIQEFTTSEKLVCFEMVEINPTLDNKENLMAETAFKILKSTVESIEKTIIK